MFNETFSETIPSFEKFYSRRVFANEIFVIIMIRYYYFVIIRDYYSRISLSLARMETKL